MKIMFDTLTTCDPLGRSDHLVLESVYVYSADSTTVKYLYNNGEYQHFNIELLNFDWDHAFDGMSVDEMWSIFHTKYTHLLNKYVPTQYCSGSRVTAQWMNTSVLGAIRRKCKAWHKFQATLHALHGL